jgi:hypothetical protein
MDRKLVHVGFSIKDPPKQKERQRTHYAQAVAKKVEKEEEVKKERDEWFPHKPSRRKVQTGVSVNFPSNCENGSERHHQWRIAPVRDADRDATLIELDLEISQARREDWATVQRPYTSDPRNHLERSYRPPRTPNNTSGPVLHRPITAAMVRLSAEEGHHWNKTTKPDEEEPPRPQTVGDTKSRDSFHRMYRLAQPKFDRVSLDKDVGELF